MALAAKYTGEAVKWRAVLDDLDILQASQNLAAFCYSFGKTRIFHLPEDFDLPHIIIRLRDCDLNVEEHLDNFDVGRRV